jgi:hypothetical protein
MLASGPTLKGVTTNILARIYGLPLEIFQSDAFDDDVVRLTLQ